MRAHERYGKVVLLHANARCHPKKREISDSRASLGLLDFAHADTNSFPMNIQ